MAILWMDSFDTYTSVAGINARYSNLANTVAPSASGRFGTNGYVLNGQNTTISRVIPTTTTGGVAMARKVVASTTDLLMFEFRDAGTQQVGIYITPANQIRAVRGGSTTLGTSTLVVPAGAYNHFEAKVTIDPSAGSVEVRVNSVVYLSLTSQNTRASANSSFDRIFMVGTNSAVDVVDDLVIWDTTGSTNNNFLGDVRISACFPTGAGNYTQWTPSTGSNWQNVDDASPNDDTDYNSDSTPGHRDSFAITDLPASATAVLAVAYTLYARKDDAGARTIAPFVRISTTDYDGTTVAVPATYAWVTLGEVHETSPATSTAWTVSEVNGMEYGVKEVA